MKIPKSTYDDDINPAWLELTNSEGKPMRPMIRCRCGEVCNIKNHHVHPDGRVTESFLHGSPVRNPCGFHEMLELEDWNGLEFLPGQETLL